MDWQLAVVLCIVVLAAVYGGRRLLQGRCSASCPGCASCSHHQHGTKKHGASL